MDDQTLACVRGDRTCRAIERIGKVGGWATVLVLWLWGRWPVWAALLGGVALFGVARLVRVTFMLSYAGRIPAPPRQNDLVANGRACDSTAPASPLRLHG